MDEKARVIQWMLRRSVSRFVRNWENFRG